MNGRLDRLGQYMATHADAIACCAIAVSFAIRLIACLGSPANPDEAMNFIQSNADDAWSVAVRGTATSAHPPLWFVIQWFTAKIDLSVFVLRLPWVLAGTASMALAYVWLREAFGLASAFCALALFGFAFPMLFQSTEARAYPLVFLLTLLAIRSLWLGETRPSPLQLSLVGVWLGLAVLNHYSVLLVCLCLGLFALSRILHREWSFSMVLAWAGGQVLAASIAAGLWFLQISKLQGSGMEDTAREGWLSAQYYNPNLDNPLGYLFRQVLDLFEYLFWIRIPGLGVVALIFIVSAYPKLIARYGASPGDRFNPRLLVVLPFIIAAGVALFGFYPFGGTRHSSYLAVFAYLAICIALGKLSSRQLGRLGVGLALFSLIGSIEIQIDRWRNFEMGQEFVAGISALGDTVPSGDWVLASQQSAYLIGFYHCPNAKPVGHSEGFTEIECGQFRLVLIPAWNVEPDAFAPALATFSRAFEVPADTRVYAASIDFWDDELVYKLQEQGYPVSQVQKFGPMAFGSLLTPDTSM